jgi:Family of unknown function (DUF6464)
VVQILLILAFLIGFLAVIFQLTKREALRGRHRIAVAIESGNRLTYKRIPRDPEEYYVEGIGYIIGDVSCRYNACSPYVRCAVNPSGLCDGCREYQQKITPHH